MTATGTEAVTLAQFRTQYSYLIGEINALAADLEDLRDTVEGDVFFTQSLSAGDDFKEDKEST